MRRQQMLLIRKLEVFKSLLIKLQMERDENALLLMGEFDGKVGTR